MSYWPFSWPSTRSWVDGGGVLAGTGTIVTCRPWAANRPSSCAMYRPAESMAGNALTTMSVFSSLSRGEPPPDPPDEHPAVSIVTATADAMSRWRDFILAPSGSAASHATRDRLGGAVPGRGDRLRHGDHNVPHRPSHAKQYGLSGSGSTLLSIPTQRGDRGQRASPQPSATFDVLARGRGSKTRRMRMP